MVQIFKAGDDIEPALTIYLEFSTGILTLDASNLPIGGGDYSVSFSSGDEVTAASFSVLPQQEHVYRCGKVRGMGSTTSDPLVVAVAVVARLFLTMVVCAALRRNKRTLIVVKMATSTSDNEKEVEKPKDSESVATAEDSDEMEKN